MAAAHITPTAHRTKVVLLDRGHFLRNKINQGTRSTIIILQRPQNHSAIWCNYFFPHRSQHLTKLKARLCWPVLSTSGDDWAFGCTSAITRVDKTSVIECFHSHMSTPGCRDSFWALPGELSFREVNEKVTARELPRATDGNASSSRLKNKWGNEKQSWWAILSISTYGSLYPPEKIQGLSDRSVSPPLQEGVGWSDEGKEDIEGFCFIFLRY